MGVAGFASEIAIAPSYRIGTRVFERTHVGSYEFQGDGRFAFVIESATTAKYGWLFVVCDFALNRTVKRDGFADAPEAIREAVAVLTDLACHNDPESGK